MSVTIETLVFCDVCGENHAGDDRASTAAVIRRSRARMGWIQIGSKDYCEKCAIDLKKFSKPPSPAMVQRRKET